MDASAVNRVELRRPRSAHVLRHLAIGILFGAGLFIAGGGIYGLSSDVLGSAWVLGLGLLVLVGAEALRRANLNQLRPGALEVTEEKLSIECPPLLRGPIALDLRNVSVATTAVTTRDGETSFPVYGYSDGSDERKVVDELAGGPEWLPVRSLGAQDSTPNAILLFESPVVAPEVRRNSPNAPRSSEALGGIAVSVADAGEAWRLFESFGLRSHIHEEDLERLAKIAVGEVQVEGADEAGA